MADMNDTQKKLTERNFTYHPPKGDQAEKYIQIRAKAKELVELIYVTCPEGREKQLSITKLEETVMWANASIARE